MEKNQKIARRSFFSGLGVLAVAGVTAKVLAPAAPDITSAIPSEPEGDSYRLTEHIKKYYRTTTI